MATGVKRDILKSVIVLSAITLIAGLLLGIVSQFTQITEQEQRERVFRKLNAIYLATNGYTSVEHDQNDNIDGLYRAKDEDYYIVVSRGSGYKGPIQLFVSFRGNELVKITVGSNSDSPGIKDNVFKESYLQQYYGDIYEKVYEFSKEGIDSVSGATYTSNGVMNAVRNAVNFYKQYIEGKTAEDILFAKLNSIYDAENGWTDLKVTSDFIRGMYKAKGEDYYIVRSLGRGYNYQERDAKIPIELYILISPDRKIEGVVLENSKSRKTVIMFIKFSVKSICHSLRLI